MRVPYAAKADRIVRTMYDDTMSNMRMYLREPERYANLILSLDDDETVTNVQQFNSRLSQQRWLSRDERTMLERLSDLSVTLPGEDGVTLRRWAQNRVIYSCDADLAQALEDTDWSDTKIPASVLRNVPHPNPAVVLSSPLYAPYDEPGKRERYDMFVIVGARMKNGTRVRCATNHPDVSELSMHWYGNVVSETNGNDVQQMSHPDLWGVTRTVRPMIGMRVLTPMQDASMGERIDFAIADIYRNGVTQQVGWETPEIAEEATRRMTVLGLGILTYICSDAPDIALTKEKTGKGKKSKRNASVGLPPSTVLELGYRIGKSLRAGSGPQSHKSGDGDGTRTVRPHMRRAHTHTYRVGPGELPPRERGGFSKRVALVGVGSLDGLFPLP